MGLEKIGYPLEDGISMPFQREGELWVYCVICDETVRVSDSVPVSQNKTLRACKKHYVRFNKSE